jgi:hypothetical protein
MEVMLTMARPRPSKAWIKHAKANAKDKRLGPTIREWYVEELRKIGVKV